MVLNTCLHMIKIHQRGMRVARLLSRIQGLEQKLGYISNATEGLEIIAPLDYP